MARPRNVAGRRRRKDTPVLAYLFWHQPADEVDRAGYEEALLAFHDRLRAVRVGGLVASGSARVEGLPWMPGAGYEDAYLVEDFGALGTLNAAAVDHAHARAHDRVAYAAGFGAGALYALESGDQLRPDSFGAWVTKPPGVSYAQFRDQLAPHTPPNVVAVWRRQMVLGPSPEFHFTSGHPFALPDRWKAVTCRLDVIGSPYVWPPDHLENGLTPDAT